MKIEQFTTILLLCLGLHACDKPEAIPAYLDIEPFSVNATGGAAWQKITEGWLYVNGNLLGAYTLPASVPVLAEGKAEVQIFPGIKENGITATPALYNVMLPYKTNADLKPGEAIHVKPSTLYNSLVRFAWSEDLTTFDGSASIKLSNRDTDPGNSFSFGTEGGFAGKYVSLEVDTAHAFIEIEVDSISLPGQAERQSWLELHYKNDVPFTLSLIAVESFGDSPAVPVYLFNNNENWNKIYLNLTGFVTGLNAAEAYKLVFSTKLPLDESGKFKQLKGKVALDNIRLIHF